MKGMRKLELRFEKLRGEMEEHGQKIQQEAQNEADKRTSKRQQRIAVYDWELLQVFHLRSICRDGVCQQLPVTQGEINRVFGMQHQPAPTTPVQ